MAYLGGKSKGADHILRVLNHEMFDSHDFLEPFVGYAHILRRVVKKRSYSAGDVNPLLVMLLKAIQSNTPLPTITRERYTELRNQTDITLERAVAAFQYSFNGKEWGGWVGGKNDTPTYARLNGRIDNMASSRKQYYDKLHDNPTFQATQLSCCSYEHITPFNQLCYVDPPYCSTTKYGAQTFDSARFWERIRQWSLDNIVFVSEYQAPRDFVLVASHPKKCCIAGGHKQTTRMENLYTHHSLLPRLQRIPRPLTHTPSEALVDLHPRST
jgi:DNA adenine methylase|tara:strand:- start:500 stop:1309 length:810 start_codon:yes stop_codon:yes gene_type:complete